MLAPTAITIRKMTEDMKRLQGLPRDNPNRSIATLMRSMATSDATMTTDHEPDFDFQLPKFTDLLEELTACAERLSGPEAGALTASKLDTFFADEDFLSLESLGMPGSRVYDDDYDGQESVLTGTDFGCEFLCTGCMSPLRGVATEWFTCTECSVALDAYEICKSCHENGCHSQHADFLELYTDPLDHVEASCDGCGIVFQHDTQIVHRYIQFICK